MSGPKRAPGHYRAPRGFRGFTGINPDSIYFWALLVGCYFILTGIGGFEWPRRVLILPWHGIKAVVMRVME